MRKARITETCPECGTNFIVSPVIEHGRSPYKVCPEGHETPLHKLVKSRKTDAQAKPAERRANRRCAPRKENEAMNDEKAQAAETPDSAASALSAGLCGFLRNARVVCNRCGRTLPETPRWAGAYSCCTCNSWTANVHFESARLLDCCAA